MKNPLLKTLAALLFCVPFTAAQAQIFPALTNFNANTGTLQLPALAFNGSLYYMEMTVADAGALTLAIDESSVVDITPDGSLSGNTPANLIGTWDVDGEDTVVVFNEDATWSLTQAAGADAESCPDGGAETGTFRYTASTGVFMPIFLTDENGDCGLSSAEGVIRIYPDGNTLTLQFTSDDSATLVRSE